MVFRYKTKGTCTSEIVMELDDEHIIKSIEFKNGCSGNLKGIAALVVGRKAEGVINVLSGITCGFKNTSCPDQLSKALFEAISNEN